MRHKRECFGYICNLGSLSRKQDDALVADAMKHPPDWLIS